LFFLINHQNQGERTTEKYQNNNLFLFSNTLFTY